MGRNEVHESDHRHEVGSLTIDPPYECNMRSCSDSFTHHYSSGLYSTRLETRTKESSKYASRTVLNRLVRRSERNHCDPAVKGRRNNEVLTGTLSVLTGTRKMVIYA